MNFWYIQHTGTPKDEWITTKKVREYRDSLKEGETVDGPQKSKIKILRKYRHFAMTTGGTQNYTDLYMFNVRRLDCTETGYMFNRR